MILRCMPAAVGSREQFRKLYNYRDATNINKGSWYTVLYQYTIYYVHDIITQYISGI